MNAQEAAEILGITRRRNGKMVRVLTLFPWFNTAEDAKRREAALWALTYWKEYQDDCVRRRGTAWSSKRCLNIELLKDPADERCHHRVSQDRVPLSQTESRKNSGHYPVC
jgi:hypothetical protein